MDNNRIGDACWYRIFSMPERTWTPWRRGFLRAWSTNYIEGEGGFGNYPVAVVENAETLSCDVPYVGNISFADTPPAPE